MRIAIYFATAVALLGCDQSKPAPETSAPATPVTAALEPLAIELAPVLPEQRVRATLQAWLIAQNDGDLDGYVAQYADKFEGIKRVGARMYRYDRDGWVKDRARMFKKKMNVTADAVQIQTTPRTAVVQFVQTWASGTYKDEGPKQLVMALQGEKLAIAREEMLSSKVSGQGKGATAYDPHSYAILIDGAVVLDTKPKTEWGSGEPQIRRRPTSAKMAVDVPGSGFESWVGSEFELFGSDGQPCNAKVATLELVARAQPHFATVGFWNADSSFTEAKEPMTDAYVAKSLWELATDGPMGFGVALVGVLDKKCEGAVWARPAGSKLARPLAAKPLEGSAREAALEGFTDLPGYHQNQSTYDEFGNKGPWHESDEASVAFTRYGPWVFGTAQAGHGCGSFEGSFWTVYKDSSMGGLVLQSDEESPGLWDFAPHAAFEFNGAVHFVEPERVLGELDGSWELLHHVVPPNFDCGC